MTSFLPSFIISFFSPVYSSHSLERTFAPWHSESWIFHHLLVLSGYWGLNSLPDITQCLTEKTTALALLKQCDTFQTHFTTPSHSTPTALYQTPYQTLLYHTITHQILLYYTIPRHTISYEILLYHTIPFYNTIPDPTLTFNIILSYIILYHTIPCNTIPHPTTSLYATHHITVYHIIPRYTLHYIILYQTTPYHTMLYHTKPYHTVQ